eukprot:TRINITY_DN3337_c0_g1_i1.p1 TRINITY_DN3337_c0_g1~~TRINITY_DN3337_c0_g1_i1.p1  ORF type:complete len:193 (+),score=47.98 TRINITY_DN3337_c0_g1_i1:500-1078(+)
MECLAEELKVLREEMRRARMVQDVLGREQRKEYERVSMLCSEVDTLRARNKELLGVVSGLRDEVVRLQEDARQKEYEVKMLKDEITTRVPDGLQVVAASHTPCTCSDGWDACLNFGCGAWEVDKWIGKQATPLHLAAAKSNEELIEHLLGSHGGDEWIDEGDAFGVYQITSTYMILIRGSLRGWAERHPRLL